MTADGTPGMTDGLRTPLVTVLAVEEGLKLLGVGLLLAALVGPPGVAGPVLLTIAMLVLLLALTPLPVNSLRRALGLPTAGGWGDSDFSRLGGALLGQTAFGWLRAGPQGLATVLIAFYTLSPAVDLGMPVRILAPMVSLALFLRAVNSLGLREEAEEGRDGPG